MEEVGFCKTACLYQRVYIYPLLFVLLIIITIAITFPIALYKQHVYFLFPYFTDLGARYPEGSYFATLMTTSSLFALISVYIRYRKIRFVCDNAEFKEKEWTYCLNQVSFLLGFFMALGIAIVSNSPYTSIYIAGLFLSVSSILYITFDALLSHLIYPAFGNKKITLVKVILDLICIISCIIKYIFGAMALSIFNGYNTLHWTPNMDGYFYHLIAALFDWIFILAAMVFFILYIFDFYNIHFEEPFLVAKCESCSIKRVYI
ncbi:DNA damage-regulated autophagy modulator protein 1-like [Rhynchophorus ferrugineus]|uniref:CWH43-like N-terminal domain-containing protein n=1 Tax=Rhynchophorus ferrugineus TaxID=354439 RepID=A0A834ISM4_RHYFE|nr:hypothetical protein GWI33_022284 [Rhynchophorus ferrugineus]